MKPLEKAQRRNQVQEGRIVALEAEIEACEAAGQRAASEAVALRQEKAVAEKRLEEKEAALLILMQKLEDSRQILQPQSPQKHPEEPSVTSSGPQTGARVQVRFDDAGWTPATIASVEQIIIAIDECHSLGASGATHLVAVVYEDGTKEADLLWPSADVQLDDEACLTVA